MTCIFAVSSTQIDEASKRLRKGLSSGRGKNFGPALRGRMTKGSGHGLPKNSCGPDACVGCRVRKVKCSGYSCSSDSE